MIATVSGQRNDGGGSTPARKADQSSPGGRRDPADLHVTVHGDEDVARRVLAALPITP